MKTSRAVYALLTACAAAGALSSPSAAEETTSHLKFSDPAKPGTLKVNVMGGDLRIQGSDTDELTVVSDAKPNSAQKRSDGLRVLTQSSSFSLEEKNNVATLEAGYGRRHGGNSTYRITVPKHTAVVVSNQYGDTVCTGVDGDIEVRSNNGSVALKAVSAGASVETMNGTIHVNVARLLPEHALSFSSMNGEIVIHLPDASKANLQLRTQNGTILTDFDEKDLVAKTASDGRSVNDDDFRAAIRQVADAAREAARSAREAAQLGLNESGMAAAIAPIPPIPPLPPMTGGQTVTGILHGGGTAVQATTMNGDVTVRKE